MRFARTRQFIEAVTAHDFEAAEELLDPDVETVTPRGTLRGIAACRQVGEGGVDWNALATIHVADGDIATQTITDLSSPGAQSLIVRIHRGGARSLARGLGGR